MTQVSSIKKGKSFFSGAMGHNFKYNVKDNMKLMIVIFVLHFAAAPLMLITLLTEILTKHTSDIDEGFMAAAVIGTGLAAASGIICALSVFKYLYNKSAVDMRLSLPMTTSQRFVSDFLSGLFIYIIPYFAAEIISWVLMLAGHILCDGKTFTYTTPDTSAANGIRSYSWVCTIFEELAPFLWRGMLGGLMLMIMFYAVIVLAAGCCGSIFEAAAYGILLNCLIPVTALLGISAVCNNIYGLNSDFYMRKLLPYCGPFGGAYGLVLSLENLRYEKGYETANNYMFDPLYFGKWFVIFTLCTAAVIIGTYLIYRRRKAEDTGKPVVYGIFHHIIMTMGIFSLCYLMMIDGTSNFVPVIVISFIAYMVMHVIRNRGFGKIISGLVTCVLTILLSIGSFLLIEETKAFGASEYVPDAEKIKSAEISYIGMFNENYYDVIPAKISDPAVFEILTQLHSEVITSCNEINTDDLTPLTLPNGLGIKYTLNSGRTVYRYYNRDFFTDKGIELLSSLDITESVQKSRGESIKNNILGIRDSLEYYKKNSNTRKLSDLYVKLSPQWRYSTGGKDFDGSYSIGYNDLPEDFIESFAENMYADITAETEEEYFTPEGNVYQIEIFGVSTYFIKDSYANTLEYLKACGFNELPVITAEGVKKIMTEFERGSEHMTVASNPLKEYMTGKDSPVFSIHINGSSGSFKYKDFWIRPSSLAAAYEYYGDIYTLMTHSYKAYKTDESCYTIMVGGREAVIPSEYSDIAERVFIRMTADRANYMADKDFWTSPYEYDDYTGEKYSGYSDYLGCFLEFYGRDKIISALSYYYDSEAAEKTYEDLEKWSKVNTDFSDDSENSYPKTEEVFYQTDATVIYD